MKKGQQYYYEKGATPDGVILFSGGLDSVMLALLLARRGLSPQPVYMSHRANVGNVTKKELKAASKLAQSILGKKLIIVKAPAKGKEPSWYQDYGDVVFSTRLPVPKERKDQRNRIFLKVLKDLDLAGGTVALGLFDSEATQENRKRWADIRTPDMKRSLADLKTSGELVTLTSLGYQDKAAALKSLGRGGKIPSQLWSSESCLMYFNKPCGDCASCKSRAEAFLTAWGEDKTPYRPKSVAGKMKRQGRANRRRGRRATRVAHTDITNAPGTNRHVTRCDEGTLPVSMLLKFKGGRAEHRLFARNPRGRYSAKDWKRLVADIRKNGVKEPLTIRVYWVRLSDGPDWRDKLPPLIASGLFPSDSLIAESPHFEPLPGESIAAVEPIIFEGNHRLRAAAEAGLDEVPVDVCYFGHSDKEVDLGGPSREGRANRSLRSRAAQVRKEAEGIWREIGPKARHPDYRSKKKPAAGRCYQTALWMRDKFKGHGKTVLVQGAEGSCKKHYWLRVGGTDVDITGDQYGHPKVQVGALPYQGKVRSWPKSRVPSGHPGAMMRGRANRSQQGRGQRFILLELILAGRIGHLERRMQKLEGQRNLHPTARTAITRNGPSAPVKALWKAGLIKAPVLDFGSGRGEDARWLRGKGLKVDAYDPHHGPTQLPERKYATVLATYVHCVLPRAQQTKATQQVRSRLRDGGRGLITVRTDTCPSPPGGVQECVKMSFPVAERGSGFQTFEVSKKGAGHRAKRIGSRSWVHVSALSELPSWVQRRVRKIGGSPDLIRFDRKDRSIMLGWAPEIGTEAIVPLERSDLYRRGRPVLRRSYEGDSRPVYHRTELMFRPGDPRRATLAKKTLALEKRGLLGRSDIGTVRSVKKARS